ncbi:MAG: putative hydrolase of the superfamily [Actinomycetota bacterium]
MAPTSGVVIALDVDGVLIDPTRGGAGHWLEVVGPRFGVTADDMAPFFRGAFRDVTSGRRTVEDALADHFASRGVDHLAFLDAWLDEDAHPNDEVVKAAEEWARRGVAIVLATTQEHRRVDRLRALFGDRLQLADVLYSADLGAAKPDPEFFRRADARLGGRRVVFVDDMVANVEAARVHGWTAVHYPAERNWRDVVDSYLR